MDIRIYSNTEETEFAICCEGDHVMRAVTATGIQYMRIEGLYSITATSDLAFIDAGIQERLNLSVSHIDNCCEAGTGFECCNCLKMIENGEAHGEMVLYAGNEVEIGMIAAYHNDCSEA